MALLAGTTSPPQGKGNDMLTLPKDWNPYGRTGGSPQSNFDSRRYGVGGGGGGGGGFSAGFLNYLADARAMKLREKEMGIGLTGAQIGLTGAQTGKVGAETADIYGMTDPSRMKMGVMEAQIDETYGRTAPSRASMANIYADIAGKYGQTAPMQANMYATYAGANANLMRAGGSRTTTMNNLGPFGGQTTTSPISYFSPMAGGGGGGGGGGSPYGGSPYVGSPYTAMASATQNGLIRPQSASNGTSYFFGPMGGMVSTVIPAEPSTSKTRQAALNRYSATYDRYLS